MDAVERAVEIAKSFNEKLDVGVTITAEEYATALNAHSQVVNEATDQLIQVTAAMFVVSLWEDAMRNGYTVDYDENNDTFSVTESKGQ